MAMPLMPRWRPARPWPWSSPAARAWGAAAFGSYIRRVRGVRSWWMAARSHRRPPRATCTRTRRTVCRRRRRWPVRWRRAFRGSRRRWRIWRLSTVACLSAVRSPQPSRLRGTASKWMPNTSARSAFGTICYRAIRIPRASSSMAATCPSRATSCANPNWQGPWSDWPNAVALASIRGGRPSGSLRPSARPAGSGGARICAIIRSSSVSPCDSITARTASRLPRCPRPAASVWPRCSRSWRGWIAIR